MDNFFLDNNLLEQNTPVVFADGSTIYEELKRKYKLTRKDFLFMALAGLEKPIILSTNKRTIGLMEIYYGKLAMLFLKVIGGI